VVEFTLSGMVTVFVLQDRIVWGDHHPSGQARFRSLLGASDSTKSEPGTLRYEFGTGPHLNCHGELNAMVAALPFVTLALARARAWWRTRRTA
jgi:nucleoside diphosphate kinase